MTIFFNNIKRIFRKKANLVVMFVLPIAFIVGIGSLLSSSSSFGITVGLVDNDNSKLTSIIKNKLKADKDEIKIISKSEIKDDIINKKIDTAIVIPKDFAEDAMNNSSDAKIQMYGISGVTNDSYVKYYINSFTNAAKNIGKTVNGDSDKFYAGIKEYQKGNFSSEVKYTSDQKSKEETSSTLVGFLIMGVVYLSTMVTTLILEDKKYGVYKRMFASGVRSFRYMGQCILSFITVAFIQIAAILLIMKYALNIYLGPSMLNLFIVLFIFGICCVALGVAISNRSKNLKQANTLVMLVSTPMLMLGGCYWPREITPTIVQRIGDFVPTTWAMEAAGKIISGNSIMNVGKEMGIIVIFIILFFIVASVKRVETSV